MISKLILKWNNDIDLRLLIRNFRNLWWKFSILNCYFRHYYEWPYLKYKDYAEKTKIIHNYERFSDLSLTDIFLRNVKYMITYKFVYGECRILCDKRFNKFVDLNNIKCDVYDAFYSVNIHLKRKIFKKFNIDVNNKNFDVRIYCYDDLKYIWYLEWGKEYTFEFIFLEEGLLGFNIKFYDFYINNVKLFKNKNVGINNFLGDYTTYMQCKNYRLISCLMRRNYINDINSVLDLFKRCSKIPCMWHCHYMSDEKCHFCKIFKKKYKYIKK